MSDEPRPAPGPDPASEIHPHPEPDRPHRVVRIVTRLNVGGPALQIAGHARELPRTGIDQLIVHGRPEPAEGDLSSLLRGTASRTLSLPGLVRPIRPLLDLMVLVKLVGILRRERPDVVHTHLFKAGFLGRIAAWIARVPLRVHTFHGTIFEGHFGRAGSWLTLTAERGLARITHAIVALSESQGEDLVERFRVAPRSRVVVIPPGFDLRRFESAWGHRNAIRAELGAEDGSFVVLVLGRLAAVKNVGLALAVLERARDRIDDLRVWIAGDGPERACLERESEERGLGSRTRFLGFREDTDRLLGGADLLLVTSRSEGLPVAVIEARAAGCPVVGTAVGGMRDLVEDGRTGVLREARGGADAKLAAEELAGILVELASAPERRSELAAAAKEGIEEGFGVEAMVESHRTLYERRT